jgi:transposase
MITGPGSGHVQVIASGGGMPHDRAVPVMLSAGERRVLNKRVRGGKTAHRDWLRAQIVLAAARGRANARIAADLHVAVDTVRKWRGRFSARGLDGLTDLPRCGRPRQISALQRAAVVSLACQLPAATGVPLSRWTGPELAAEITKSGLATQISPSSVLRILAEHPIKPWQYQSWIFPRDPDFAAKAAVILGLYQGYYQGRRLAPGDRILSVDAKPSIQARARCHPTAPAARGQPVRTEHEYDRAGQDVDEGTDGVFRIARRTARDRVISTVDTAARHGHKSRNRHFDGYKAHLPVDPDSELIDEVAATAANTPDRDAAGGLLAGHAGGDDKPEVIGDSAYGDAATRAGLDEQGFTVTAKCPPARNAAGRFSKDQFTVDLQAGTVTCPAGQTAVITPAARGGKASFRPWCCACPLRPACTAAKRGRTITIHPHEAVLQRARAAQHDPAWQQRYRTGRPIVERKIAHFTRRAWGGRRARTRGLARITTDLLTRAAALNWARLAILGLDHDQTGWALPTT